MTQGKYFVGIVGSLRQSPTWHDNLDEAVEDYLSCGGKMDDGRGRLRDMIIAGGVGLKKTVKKEGGRVSITVAPTEVIGGSEPYYLIRKCGSLNYHEVIPFGDLTSLVTKGLARYRRGAIAKGLEIEILEKNLSPK